MSTAPVEVLLRGADAGDTYLYWSWLDGDATAQYSRIPAADLQRVLLALDAALVHGEDDVEEALQTGTFASRESELALARTLGEVVLPERLLRQIVVEVARRPVILRVTPSPLLARIPWEIFPVDRAVEPRRLLELVTIRYDVPATLHYRRSRTPQVWRGDTAECGPVRILDPDTGLSPVTLQVVGGPGPVLAAAFGTDPHLGDEITRGDLSERLRAGASRLLFYGHATADDHDPGSAAIHLSDGPGTAGHAEVAEGHRPLAAFDLLLGTSGLATGEDVLGHDIWPMPNRVAVVACHSGADHSAVETFGLIVAILNAGAEFVTSTRWVLPTDAAFHLADRELYTRDEFPTTELVIAVDLAHQQLDPVAALRAWQLRSLNKWRDTGYVQHSPLLWSALTTHRAG